MKLYVPVLGSATRKTVVADRTRLDPIISDKTEMMIQEDLVTISKDSEDAVNAMKKFYYEQYIQDNGIVRSLKIILKL